MTSRASLDDPRAASRFLGIAYAAGAALAIASMALPQPPGTDVAGLFGIYAVALAVGVYLLLRGARLVDGEIAAALLAGTVMVSLAIHFTEERTGVYSLFYVWIAIESVYFLSRRAALLQLLGIAAAFGLVLSSERPPGAEEQWLITVGTVALAGILVGALKANVERLIARLAAAAHTDPLTGLSNRRAFQDELELELQRARRTERPVSLLVADLDHFKRVNDLLGHPGGDRVLKQFAGQMTRLTRVVDLAARLGGEEFALVLPEAAKHDALLVAERLRRAVKSTFVDTSAPLTVSIGVTCFPDDGASADDLLRAGDQALYAAKKLGRDRTVLFNAEVIADVVHGEAATDTQSPGQLSAVLVLAETIDARDSGTAQHSQAVGRYARASAVGLGLSRTAVERIALAGVLHDVGQGRCERRDPEEAGRARRGRVGPDAGAPRARSAHPGRRGPARHRGVGLRPSREARRERVSARAPGRGHPARGPHPGGGRRLRGDDERPPVSRRHVPRGCGRRAPALLGHAVRRARRRCAAGGAAGETEPVRGKPHPLRVRQHHPPGGEPGAACPTWATRSASRGG